MRHGSAARRKRIFPSAFTIHPAKKRADYLKKACDIILEQTQEDRVCGIVSNIGREGQSARVLMLSELRDTQVDMFTTVFIGNSQTRKIGERMVTPRGYRI